MDPEAYKENAVNFLITVFGPPYSSRSREWMKDALCRDLPPSLFFPDGKGEQFSKKLPCKGCPVRLECELYGQKERFGYWGGLFIRQRRKNRDIRKEEVA
jgi:hypothetical protein